MFRENSFWFAHPVYFINHLDRMGAFEFNPYQGYHKQLNEIEFTCFTNPGFAPLRYDDVETEFRYNNEYYADVTGLFNANYLEANRKRKEEDWGHYFHEGVDFAGGQYGGKPVKSFIYGKVRKSGVHKTDENEGMGGYVVVQDAKDPGLYYVLVHLAEYAEEGLDVYPGTVVGTVGRDIGRTSGFHLHVSHVRTGRLEEVIDGNIFRFWKRGVRAEDEACKKVLDPFDHSKTWAGRGVPKNKK
jgi:murein DD-endopeptidase MepM/ murein hydrolase activator NlpD